MFGNSLRKWRARWGRYTYIEIQQSTSATKDTESAGDRQMDGWEDAEIDENCRR
jgi:hypothetical protein